MIGISNSDRELIRVIPLFGDEVLGFHKTLGFVSERTFHNRSVNRKRQGFRELPDDYLFKICFQMPVEGNYFRVLALDGCSVEQLNATEWAIESKARRFIVGPLESVHVPVLPVPQKEKEYSLVTGLLLALLCFGVLFVMPEKKVADLPLTVIEQVAVHIEKEKQKAVTMKEEELPVPVPKPLQENKQLKRAIAQNLGFLGMLGRKDLTKALGGMPTSLKDASPGAGAGGKEGSGGAYLVGLGQGLKRTTVGNTGTVGLGGIGTKGAVGGQGGYGNTMIGSGEGKALSSMPLSKDVSLEGGLDRSVVQATIAKYLSQVRSCYEEGLKRNAGLAGTVTMAFEVSGLGNLNFAHVARSSLGDKDVEDCIGAKMLTWKFPNPRGGVNVKISYPFMLRPVRE